MIHQLRLPAMLVLASALTCAGCDTGVTPVLGTEQPFSLFGLFSPQLDTQRVLVFPIEDQLRLLPGEPLAARFTSTDLSDGRVLIWRDSLVEQANGGFNHLFWHPFSAEFDRTYSVDVEHASGTRTTATVIVPPESEIILLEPDLRSEIVLPVLVAGGVPNLLKVDVEYGFEYRQLSPGPLLERLSILYDERKRQVEEGWLIRINLSGDFRQIREFIRSQRSIDTSFGIRLRGIRLTFIAASADWDPPGGLFDPEILVQPGSMSNVEDGFGFIGAGYRAQRSWLPADSIVEAAGFRPLRDAEE